MKRPAFKRSEQPAAGPNLRPRNFKEEADQIRTDYLRILQTQFFLEDPRRFYAHRYQLLQAITWPQRMMLKMGVFMPFDTQRGILDLIISDIKKKGNTSSINHFGGYFLHCVQTHVKLRLDHYYDDAKAAAAVAVSSLPLDAILAGAVPQEGVMTEGRAAEYQIEIADTFKPKRRPKAEKPSPKKSDDQMALFTLGS